MELIFTFPLSFAFLKYDFFLHHMKFDCIEFSQSLRLAFYENQGVLTLVGSSRNYYPVYHLVS